MGAIFNTRGTREILRVLNEAFGNAAFQSNIWNNVALITDLRKPVAELSSYDLCVNYGFVTGDAGVNDNWRIWLDYFDQHGGQAIRNDIANQLQNNSCIGIEFFAVPARNWSVRPSHPLPDQAQPNKHTLIISVETPTYDQLH
jgi:hypothetical protein